MQGRLIVFTGPSGVGKGTVEKLLEFNNFVFSVSLTTRKKRDGEVDGINYHYVSKDFFKEQIESNKMLEHAEFIGNYYGTSLDFVNKELSKGNNVFLEIECQGALQVLEKVEDVVSIFLLPPSLEELEQRLRGRNTEDEETIQKRLNKAKEELNYKEHFKYNVTNIDAKESAKEIDNILNKELNV